MAEHSKYVSVFCNFRNNWHNKITHCKLPVVNSASQKQSTLIYRHNYSR